MENNEYPAHDIAHLKFLTKHSNVLLIPLNDSVFCNKSEKKMTGDDSNIKTAMWDVSLDRALSKYFSSI